MSKYELDDDLVRRLINARSGLIPDTASHELALALEDQIPLPAPAQIGAVVRTGGFPSAFKPEPTTFIRWATDSRTTSPWIEAGNHEQPYRTDEIGRIVEVLSEGVDL